MEPESSPYHQPVLPVETLHYLAPQPGEVFLDATLGGGGHSVLIAQALQSRGTLIGLDRDTDALKAAGVRLHPFEAYLNIILLHSAFGKLDFALESHEATVGIGLDGALFDLGVSSHQLDTARGFSFRREERLDMRMDASTGPSAADLLAHEPEAEIARILWEYGEERFSRRIAKEIVTRRARGQHFETTAQLVDAVESGIPRPAWPKDIHVATRTFQALRIAVNGELAQLEAGVNAAIARLNPGGRIVVISYHSLEDRIVKQIFAREAGRTPHAPGSSPAAFLPTVADREPILSLLTRKPILPTPEEIARNPRARSAKLRAAERLP